jgi:hypothetical protein
MIPEIAHLPKYMQRKPEIAAYACKVYPGDGPRHWRVPGTSSIHDVYRMNTTYKCSCQGGRAQHRCKHSIAVQRYCEQENI